jgi:hypothetical protein
MILSCGCKSENEGIFCEWDAYSKECEDAVAYGCVCALCYIALNARPTEKEQDET